MVTDYYERFDEQERLRQCEGRLEFARTCEIVSRYLGNDRIRVLDVGGGAGVYAFWLANLGHEVHLLDLSPRHIEQAAAFAEDNGLPLASIQQGDARSLSQPDSSFDMVLLLGPLYHLVDRSERLVALTEAARVVKPGGHVLCAAISRFASLMCGFVEGLIEDPDFERIVDRDLLTGVHENPTEKDYFTTSFFHLPGQLREEIGLAGLDCAALLAVEGFAGVMPGFNDKWSDPAYRAHVMKYLAKVEAEESLLGVSSHLVGVGLKR